MESIKSLVSHKFDLDSSKISPGFSGGGKPIILEDHVLLPNPLFNLQANPNRVLALNLKTLEWRELQPPPNFLGGKSNVTQFCHLEKNKFVWIQDSEMSLFSNNPKKQIKMDVVSFDPEKENDRSFEKVSEHSGLIQLNATQTRHFYKNALYTFGGHVPLFNMSKSQAIPISIEELIPDKKETKLASVGMTGPRLPGYRSGHCSVLYQDKIYLYGGWEVNKIASYDFWKFDLENNSCTEIRHENTPQLKDPLMTVLNNQIFLLGKKDSLSNTYKLYQFDPEIKLWSPIGSNYEIEEAPITFGSHENQLVVVCKAYLYKFHSTTDTIPQKLTARNIQVQSENFASNGSKFLQNQMFSDISLKVGDKLFPAHRVILAIRSTFFSQLFSSGMKECEDSVLEISDISSEALSEILRYVYSDQICLESEKIAIELIRMADKYLFPKIKEACEEFLIKRLTVENVIDYGLIATEVDAPKLEDSVIQLIRRNIEAVFEKDDPRKLPKSILLKLYTNKK